MYADREDVLVPDIFWDYTSSKVLTMEWVDGVKLNEQDAIEKQGLKVLDLVNTGIQCSLRQLLEYGYFHADPHPGNLLATPEGKLAFLDFGMMSETPEEARFAIIGHVVHMVNRDYEAMARDYYALDFLSPDVDVTPIVPALRNFFDDALNSTVSELNFKTLVDGLGAVLYQYPFNGELRLCLLVIQFFKFVFISIIGACLLMVLVFIISSVVNDCATSLLFSCIFILSYFFRLPVCLCFVDIALDEIKYLSKKK